MIIAGILILGNGCRSPKRTELPELSPEEAGAKAVKMYDTNKDKALDKTELKKCGALAHAMKKIDKNTDNKITAEEIAGRIRDIRATKIAILDVPIAVKWNGKLMAGVEVRIVPEEFMGPGIKAASGVTGRDGVAALQIEGRQRPGVHLGYFKIKVSKKSGGSESIPKKYNENTTLGVEISPDIRGIYTLNLN